MFARRNGIDPEHAIWDMDMAIIAQLIHAEMASNGIACLWSEQFEPDEDLLAEFDMLAKSNHTEIR